MILLKLIYHLREQINYIDYHVIKIVEERISFKHALDVTL